MKRNKDVVAYNLIFPIWAIVIFPPILIFTLPVNFFFDSIVCLLGLWIFSDQVWKKYKKYILKVFLLGYLADIIGAIPLVILYLNDDGSEKTFIDAIAYNVFWRVDTVISMTVIVAFVGWLIYYFNRKFVFKNEVPKTARRLSILLAVLTAPYFFYFPVEWFWY